MIYYVFYGLLCALCGVLYIKFSSKEGTVVTTNEFKVFQTGFLTGYAAIILCELIASASFYHTFISLRLNLEHIVKLYLATLLATTVTGVVSEIVDVGTRKDKCVAAAVLYGVSMFSILFGGHYERLLLGRLVYGVASSLHHSSFDAYAIHEHSARGFPDDWMAQTFSLLTHAMALMAALSGVVGEGASHFGPMGCVALCCGLFGLVAVYILIVWEKDQNTSKFMLQGFSTNFNNTLIAMKSNRQFVLLVLVATFCETSITIFTFYWAPWLSSLTLDAVESLPYEIIFSTFIVASMLGNYVFQMTHEQFGSIENAFQALLICSSICYFLGAIFQTGLMVFVISIMVQFCMGGYWPSIGYMRGKIIMSEFRNTALIFPRVLTFLLTSAVLTMFKHSPLLVLSCCAIFNGAAAYIQNVYVRMKLS